MPSQSRTGRKRRLPDETEPQTPIRRCKVSNGVETVKQVLKRQEMENEKVGNEKPNSILLSSPTDVSDTKVVQQTRPVRTKQAKSSGLPNLDPIVTKVDQVAKDEEVSELETETEALTPRPSVPRRTTPRPPLSRRAVGLNRARFGGGIVRCRNWRHSGEDTETEDESPASSPRPSHSRSKILLSPMKSSGCGCANESGNSVDEKLEDQIGTSVLPINPSFKCFDRNCDYQWQVRSPSPEKEIVPEKSYK